MKPNQILLFLRGSEQVSPKCATLACGLFLAEGKWDSEGSRETFASPLTTEENLNWGSFQE